MTAGILVAYLCLCHVYIYDVLDKLEQRAYAVKAFYKNSDRAVGDQRAFWWDFQFLKVKI